jgi:hypothetical protein
MPEYEIDIRIPVKLYNSSPFVYFGPDFRSLPLGFFSDFIVHENKQYQRLYPMTLSKKEGDGSKDILFSFIYLYIDDSDQKIIHLTQPVSMVDQLEGLEALLAEADNLARFTGSGILELENYSKIKEPLFFPSSPSIINYGLQNPNPLHVDETMLMESDFIKSEEVKSFSCRIEDLKDPLQSLEKDNNLSSLKPFEFIEAKKNKFKERSFELSTNDPIFQDTRIPFFRETALIIKVLRGWIRKKEVIGGYMRWAPNIFEPCMEKGIPYPLLFYSILENYRYKGGKIFDWGFDGDTVLLRSLLLGLLAEMMELGIEVVHFGNVKKNQESVRNLLSDMGFKEAQSIQLYRRKI